MKQKKILLTGSFMLAIAAGCYGTYASKSGVKGKDLLMANVEALASAEIVQTSWNCDASEKTQCIASCGNCGTTVGGTGALTGAHTCK